MIAPGSTRLHLPPDRFYWAVLDAKAVGGRNGKLRTRLGYLFENVLPEPIEHVHATYVRVTNVRTSPYLACGMSTVRLKQTIAEHPGAVQLGPASLPEFVVEECGDATVALEQLNLLRDEFEATAVRRARTRLTFTVALVILIATGVIVLGLVRREAAIARQTDSINDMRSQLIKDTVGSGENSHQPPDVRMIAELRRLRQSRAPGISTGIDPRADDCAPILAELLSYWPSDVLMMTDSIVITPTTISIHGSAPASQDVQTLATALGGLGDSSVDGHGWSSHQPQVNAGRDGVQATLQLTRSGLKEGSP